MRTRNRSSYPTRKARVLEMTSQDPLERLKAEARYHRERLALYRARVYGGGVATSAMRLKELERACEFAAQRLQRASASLPADNLH